MSSDEIRRLAEENIFVEVVEKRDIGEGEVCDYSYKKKSEINYALLAYAAMVERCEERIEKYSKEIEDLGQSCVEMQRERSRNGQSFCYEDFVNA